MPNTTTPGLTCQQRRDLERFGERIGRFGVNLAVVDPSGGIVVLHNAGQFDSDMEALRGKLVVRKGDNPDRG